MIKQTLTAFSLLALSTVAHATPELLAPTELEYGQFELVETVEITGNINDSLLILVDDSLKHKRSDFYVIEDITEDTSEETLTVTVNLYNLPDNELADDFQVS